MADRTTDPTPNPTPSLTTPDPDRQEELREDVKAYYREAAMIGPSRRPADQPDERWGASRYDADTLADGTDDAAGLSMGCGNPFTVAELRDGETVLDLGSGAGLDVILSARRVAPTGKAFGVDFLPEMLEIARANAAEAGVDNVEFLEGMIEDLPLPDASVDVVISNCVINLAPDKTPVMTEIARVLRPGGRVAVSDVVADDGVTPPDDGGAWADCGAGALQRTEYHDLLIAVGLTDVSIEATHQTGPGLNGAIVRATKPPADSTASTATAPTGA